MKTKPDPLFAAYKATSARLDIAFFLSCRAAYMTDNEHATVLELLARATDLETRRKASTAIRAEYRCLTDRHWSRLAALEREPAPGFASPAARMAWLGGANGQSDTGISGFQKSATEDAA